MNLSHILATLACNDARETKAEIGRFARSVSLIQRIGTESTPDERNRMKRPMQSALAFHSNVHASLRGKYIFAIGLLIDLQDQIRAATESIGIHQMTREIFPKPTQISRF